MRSSGLSSTLRPIASQYSFQGGSRVDQLAGAVLDQQQHRLAVLADAEAVAVARGQTHLVQQAVGRLGVMLGVGLRPLLLEEAGRRQDGGLARHQQAVVDDVVDLGAVDRQRQGAPEAQVPEQLAHRRVGIVLVEAEHHLGAVDAGHRDHPVAAAGLVLLVPGEVLERSLHVGHVRLAADHLELVHLLVDDGGDHAVNVGQLVAGGVHLPVVGVLVQRAPTDDAGVRVVARQHLQPLGDVVGARLLMLAAGRSFVAAAPVAELAPNLRAEAVGVVQEALLEHLLVQARVVESRRHAQLDVAPQRLVAGRRHECNSTRRPAQPAAKSGAKKPLIRF